MNDELERLIREATPGPWYEVGDPTVFTSMISCDGEEGTIAFDVKTFNAALIVAAVNALPEMLALRKALDPNETKHAYIGEIKNENGSYVSWTTIKDVMAMISARARAALSQETKP